MKKMLFLACFLVGLAYAGETLYISETVKYKKGLRVRDNIKNECDLEGRIADDIARFAKNAYNKVTRDKPSGKHHVLTVEIVDVFGAGGGAWSGPKYIELKGTLKDSNGNKVGSFRARRHSMGGPLGGISGTCKILKRCSKRLGQDVAEFLVDPEEDAYLGDA